MGLIFEELSEKVIGAAIEVHRELGAGLLESAYQQCLARELSIREIEFEVEVPQPVSYKGIHLDCGYRLDMVIEDKIILELKSVQALEDIHTAQLLTYLRLSRKKLGFLINFNSVLLKDGLKRYVL